MHPACPRSGKIQPRPAVAEPSAIQVPVSINGKSKDPELNVDDCLEHIEVESREVYAARDEVLKACEVKPGERIADVGAGTGFYSRLLAKRTGWDGWMVLLTTLASRPAVQDRLAF